MNMSIFENGLYKGFDLGIKSIKDNHWIQNFIDFANLCKDENLIT